MKKNTLLLICLMPIVSQAQNTSGEIKFQETIKMEIDIPEGNEKLRHSIPSHRSLPKTLLFTSNESYYKDDALNEDLEINHEEDGQDMRIVMKNPDNKVYTNQEKDQLIQSTEFFGKYFLITGNLKSRSWKLTDEKMQILNYTCQKAILIDTSLQVSAWYTSQIPIHIGPNGFTNLPGIILRIEMDHGIRTITATQVNFREIKNNEIIKPTIGKKVNSQEFTKIRDAKMKEMGMVNGKGGGIKMIIREERE